VSKETPARFEPAGARRLILIFPKSHALSHDVNGRKEKFLEQRRRAALKQRSAVGFFCDLPADREIRWGPGFGPGGWRPGGWMGGPPDPAQIEKHVDRAIRHIAIEIDATTEQQDKLRAIVKAALF
jgi:hypothetical protein